MELIDLIKLLPNGAATIAVIVVVVLFLKQQDKINEALKQITDTFNEQNMHNQKLYQDQIGTLSNQQFVNQKAFQDQVHSLIEAHLKVSRETITALKTLESTVGVIKDKVSQPPNSKQL